MNARNYDIIGDIHGHADELVALLKKLGYEPRGGVWRHTERQAVFVGDFIDRGPKQLETVSIVRRMVENGSAIAVMGNHEFNAIAWFLRHPEKGTRHLRTRMGARGRKNRHQHSAFLQAVRTRPKMHRACVEWFLTLPLWLDLEEIRVVHACWHKTFIRYLTPRLAAGNRLTKDLMVSACRPPNPERLDVPDPSIFKAVDALTKCIETPLPPSYHFMDKDGHKRNRIRVAWWEDDSTTLGAAALPVQCLNEAWSQQPLPQSCRIGYDKAKPVFFGHYWFRVKHRRWSPFAACLDFSVAKGGHLGAYRWNARDSQINEPGFVWI